MIVCHAIDIDIVNSWLIKLLIKEISIEILGQIKSHNN